LKLGLWLGLHNRIDLVLAFDRGDDVYKIMASSIYGKAVEDITKDERFVGKTTILGAGYGMGPNKFQQQLKNFGVELELRECERIINVYRKTYRKIPELWYQAGDALRSHDA
jgi:DNA polymerase I-like protein with 3'-5' exonuclease and polymerase domains